MDTLTIILIVVVAVLLIALIIKSFSGKSGENNDEANRQIKQISLELAETKARLVQTEQQKAEELKQSAEKIAQLEKEITQAVDKGADEDVKKRLDEAKQLAMKVEQLEQELKDASKVSKIEGNNSDVEKLHKKIKRLEDELEEAGDEAEENKKTAEKLRANIEELKANLSEAERKSKQYLRDFNEAKERLDQIQKELATKEQAMDFVAEVLTAKRTNDKSVVELYRNVDAITDIILGDVRDCLKSNNVLNSDLENRFFGSELESWAITQKKTWIQGKTTIAFVGEFSAGKTSIVNRLLSQDDPNVLQLPVSAKATTAIPTYITGGVGTFFQFVTPDNELKNISESTFKRVSKEVLDQVKGVSSLIQYFVMTYKNPNLEKMSILDTPGFSSNDSEDAKRTIDVINECDALFWVFDVNAGTINKSSLKIIKENLKKPLYVVINQIDTKSKKDVDGVEALIRKTLNDEGVQVCDIIRFSKKEPLNVMMDAIHKINKDSSREFLLEDLVAFMNNQLKEASEATKKASKKVNDKKSKSDELIGQFSSALDKLYQSCNSALSIPRYDAHDWNPFVSPEYRLTTWQYNQLSNILNNITEEQTNDLVELYNNQMNTVAALEKKWQEHNDVEQRELKLQDCVNKLENAKKKLRQSDDSSSSVKIENASWSLDESAVNTIINSSLLNRSKSSDHEIQVNWGKMVKLFNERTGCSCTRDEFQSLVGFNGAYPDTKVSRKSLVESMRNILITPA